jgi:acyl phosphate:glycerol-3-phosphate acyltransferase
MEDTFTFENIAAVILAYLIGSIPTAVWVSRHFFGIEIREHGSKNSGATNTFRVLGKKAGIPVLLFDIFKGWVAVTFFALFPGYEIGSDQHVNLQLAVGLSAVLGHIFPVYAGFNGGKGIATLLGIVLAIHPQAALIGVGVFLLVFIFTGYVSLGSIIASFCFPILVILIFKSQILSLNYFSMIFAVMVLLTHQKNIERLLNNEESRMSLFYKNSDRQQQED